MRLVRFDEMEEAVSARALPWLRAACRLLPSGLLCRVLQIGEHSDVDRPAAVVFPSFQPPEPERPGAILSHHNILSNIESLEQVFRLSGDDRILGVLPQSTSFGLTGTLLLPALAGVQVVYHDDPEDATTVGRLAETHRISILPIAAVHLGLYSETVSAKAFGHLRFVVTAGESPTPELRERFADKYGLEPLEAFGLDECAPLISLNLPIVVRGRPDQHGWISGTRGHPLPGVAVRIVDPRTGEILPPDRPGLLWVSGPNVMQGYFEDPRATARVLRDGWFHTGHLARQDANGFLTVL